MLSVQPPTKKFPAELSPSALHPATAAAAGKPLLSPRPNNNGFVVPPSPRFAGIAGEGLDKWFQDLQKYEATLSAMASASEDPKFKEELGTIEQWFRLLSESEQTASLYTLLQNVNPAQIKFLKAILSQMSDSSANAAENSTTKQSGRSLRPPSLNIPLPGSPATPQFSAAPAENANAAHSEQAPSGQELLVKPADENSWASMVNTPHDLMFKKGAEAAAAAQQNSATGVPGMANPASAGMPGMLTPLNMSMLNNMGFSNEAQLLAVQLVMSGMVQPSGLVVPKSAAQQHQRQGHPNNKSHQSNNWRSPASARYPGSALRSSGLRSSGLKTGGIKSASSIGSLSTPKEEDIDPELLKDIPGWLKSLRLHKYNDCFKGMTWEQMVELDEAALETKGVAALGARRRLMRTFEQVKKKMGIDQGSAVPATAGVEASSSLPSVSPVEITVPHSAAPRF